MAEIIEFDVVYEYSIFKDGIEVLATLSAGERVEKIEAKVDTGSTFCIFERGYGESVGLEIETGISVMIGTAAGSFRAYGHKVGLTVLGIETVSTVYFAESDQFDRNVLGRIGWLDQVKLGLIEPEGKLYLSQYQR